MKTKKIVIGIIMILILAMVTGCNTTTPAERELMDLGMSSEEAKEFSEELEGIVDTPETEESVSVEEEYVVLPTEEILNAKITDLIVQYEDQIIPIDGSLSAQEMMDIIATSKSGTNADWENLYASVEPAHFETIKFTSDYTSGSINVFNNTEETCEPTACVVVGLSVRDFTIPAGGYFNNEFRPPTEAQIEAGCYTSFNTDDIDAFMAEQGFTIEYDGTYGCFRILHIDGKVWYANTGFGTIPKRDANTGEYKLTGGGIVIGDVIGGHLREEIMAPLEAQDRIDNPEFYE